MSTKIRLGVNIDHIAFIKKSRGTPYPNLIESVKTAEDAGADLITIHLREDRRHIQDKDVAEIRKYAKVLNLEMAHTDEIIDIALRVKPNFCCIVPEKRNELTTEGGLNLTALEFNKLQKLKETILLFDNNGIKTSLFINPDKKQIEIAKQVGAQLVELHTGYYANSPASEKSLKLNELKAASIFAFKSGLLVNAGHGLNYENVKSVCEIDHIKELNIGHSIIARSVFVGLKDAIRQMISIIRSCD